MKFCTRKILNLWMSLLFLLGSSIAALAQNGQFDVRFAVKNFDCANNKVTIVVQVKAHDAAHTFLMGDANYRFDYDPRIIRNPTNISQENFSNIAPSSDLNYSAQTMTGSSVGSTLGTVSLNTIYGGGGLGAKLVPATWTNVACIRFDVQDATQCIVLDWHTDTEFPITGMNEVVLSGQNDGNFDQYIVPAGGVFENYSQCIPSVCSGILAVDDINLTNKNVAVSGNAATNDVSMGGTMTFTLLSQPAASGTVVLNSNGTYTYTPATGFVGEHKAVYQVCNTAGLCDTATISITILDTPPPIGTNTAPIAQNDNGQTQLNTPVSGNVLNNDFDPNSTPLSNPTLLGNANNGTVTLNPDGSYTYTPNNNFIGQDTFRYRVCDAGTPPLCDTAMVVLNVLVDPTGSTGNDRPNAQDDAKFTLVDTPISGVVATNDSDPNAGQLLTYTVLGNPTNGSVTLSPSGNFTYTPTANYVGPDKFTYTACDNGTPVMCDTATVYIDIARPANEAPIVTETPKTTTEDSVITICQTITDVNATDTHTATLCSQPAHGLAGSPVITGGQVCVTYSPTANYNGTDTICIIVCDQSGLCDTSKTVVTVTPKEDAPVVTEDPKTVPEDSLVTICQTITDPDAGATFTATPCGAPRGIVGTPIVTGNQVCVSYLPPANGTGVDTVCIIVCDNTGLCDTVKTPIVITPKPDAPVVTETPKTVPEDSVVTICQTLTDPDAGDTHTATLCSQPAHGLAGSPVISGGQVCVTYSPTANYNGSDTICIIVCDQTGLCDTAKIPVTVTPKSDPPVVTEDPKTVPEDSLVTICQTITDPDAGATFTATPCGAPRGIVGTPIVTGNQVCVSYLPPANASGQDTICIIVCDNAGLCDTVKTPITITPRNDAPVITGTNPTTTDKVPVTVCLPITDPDVGDTFTPSLCGSPAAGIVGTPIVSGGQVCVQYIPQVGALGNQTICVQVCDAAGACDTAHIVVTVTPSNEAPVANNDINNTTKGTPTSGTVLINDNDPDGHTLTPSVIDPVNNGTLALQPNGTYTYTPNPTFVGTDTLVYKVCDNGTPSLCDTAILVIEVRDPVTGNQRPVANDENTSTPSNTPITVTVKSNDFDPDAAQTLGNPNLVGTPVGGTPSVNANGTVTFTPTLGFTGSASFQYAVCDNGTPVLCDTATVYINIYQDPTLVNQAPIAVNDANVTTGTTPVSGNAATNDTDPNAGQILSFTPITNPTKGTATMNPNGTYTYTANPATSGLDSFQYKVCDNGIPSLCDTATVVILVNPVVTPPTNTAPVATSDNPVTNTGTPVTVNVKANDFDPNGDPITNPTITTPSPNGTATVNPDGTITFTPNPGFTGTTTFIYQICDMRTPPMCDTALVSVKVDPLPVVNRPPTAINDNFVGTSGASLASKTVATNDSDPDASQSLTYSQLSLAGKGIVSFSSNGTFSYFPLAGFTVGKDSFSYRVCDNGSPSLCDTAWAIVEYAAAPPVNVAPNANDDVITTPNGTPIVINVKANDTDANGNPLSNPTIVTQPTCGTATVTALGTISFVPNAGFTGTCTLRYAVCDNGTPSLCDTATVTVTVDAPIAIPNRAPIAQNDATTTPQNTAVNGNVAPNDSDLDAGQTLAFTKLTNPANGSVVFNTNGTFTYTPNNNFVGRDSFRYQVCDNGTPSLCATAWSFIDVTPSGQNQNDKPIAGDDQAGTTPSTPVTINVKSNDIDPDGSTNTLGKPEIIGSPIGGTPSVNPDGTVTFTPAPGFVGNAQFTYQVCDNGSPVLCDTAVVTISVQPSPFNPINLPPVAVDDAQSGTKNNTINGTVASNDTDPNASQILTYTQISNPANGLVTNFDPNTGDFSYTPISNFIGTDYFIYKVCDNGNPSLCDTAIVYLTVADDPCITLNLKVLIEGPYSVATGKMKTVLNQRGLLPGQTPIGQFAVKTPNGHPYKGAPWNYAGTEGDTITTYPATVVDWVLVSLRSSVASLTPVWRCAAWLHEDGSITIPGKPCVQIPSGNYFIVIEHRNHMGVMSPATISIANNKIQFDFTAGDGYVLTNPPSFGSKALSNGKWAMYAGDGKKDTQTTNFDVNFNDSQLWKVQSGIFDQYRLGDFNLDADVNFSDQVLWKSNNGRYSGVPH